MDSVIAHAQVHIEPDGSLLVSWELEGEPVAVDLAVGPTDHVDHRHEIIVTEGRTSWRLDSPADGRLFISIGPHGSGPAVVTTDRRIGFRSITNFRDLGGYRVHPAAAIRWGMVFRADALHGLLPQLG